MWLEDAEVGTLVQRADGQLRFEYRADWLLAEDRGPISLSLPLREAAFDDRATRAFFGGLLPDDDARRRLAKYLHVSARNEFALLAEVGRECAGALSLLPPGESPPAPAPGSFRVLADAEWGALLRELPQRPLLVGSELRLSLAGAQDKVAVYLAERQLALPVDGLPTTHLLKVPIAHYPDTVANEFFCMRLAGEMGLSVPVVEMRAVGDLPILLVERYDRVRAADGRPRRLHQEDCCQALGVPPELKYQNEGGPTLPQIFELLTKHSERPALDRLLLQQMVCFHFLTGNADAHAKNFSLLHHPRGVRLAPVYDAMCTLVYPALSQRMAMKIGSKYEFAAVARQHWEALAKAAGMAPPQMLRAVAEMATRLPVVAARLATELPEVAGNATIARVVDLIDARSRAVRDDLGL